ncbi:glycosyltransferase family 1 protein [Paenibacillaceae bacterium]|nr:glycosyltransferase family 1 protein [Paenibacillaceae bacterium]
MRVLHLPVGRQMIEMCAALRKAGVKASSCHFRRRNVPIPDICLHFQALSHDEREKQRRHFLSEAAHDYDIFHFHFGETFLKDRSDLEYLKSMGKKLIVQHRGSDVRMLSTAQSFNNPYVRVKKGRRREEEQIIRKLKQLSSYIDHAIVADHELLPYVKKHYKHTHLLRQFVTLNKFQPLYPSASNKRPLIIHAPTNAYLKGTEYILEGIQRLRKKGLEFDFKLIENLSHEEAIKTYRAADIIIDQLLQGSFGVLSLEGMALGKPVICYIRDEMIMHYPPELPIVNANKHTFYDELKRLVRSAQERRWIGVVSRQYVEQHYNSHVLSRQLMAIYDQL